jgi:hypothetical protein
VACLHVVGALHSVILAPDTAIAEEALVAYSQAEMELKNLHQWIFDEVEVFVFSQFQAELPVAFENLQDSYLGASCYDLLCYEQDCFHCFNPFNDE